MTETLELEFMADDQLAGFRLQRLEVFNWGTFDGKVWTQDVFPYQAKCLAEIRAAYEALDASAQAQVSEWFAGTGCEALISE